MDVIPQLDVVHRLQSAKKPQVLPIIQSSPSSPVVDDMASSLDEIRRSQFVNKTQSTMSVDEGVLRRGFLKSRPSRSQGCSSPAAVGGFFGTSQ